MTKEELEKATGQELIEQRNYCGVDGYYGDCLNDVNAEMLKRFNRLVDLEKENAELRTKLKPENCLKLLAKEGYIKFTSDQLTKAKDLLLELYDCIPSSMADSCRETLQKVALFFKDSEVEK